MIFAGYQNIIILISGFIMGVYRENRPTGEANMINNTCTRCGSRLQPRIIYCTNCGQKTEFALFLETKVPPAAKGDQEAITVLYNETAAYYRVICNQLLGSQCTDADADDILQNAYVKIFSSLGSLSSPDAFVSWGKRIVMNEALDFLRKKRPFLVDREALYDYLESDISLDRHEWDDPQRIYDREETSRLVREIISDIPEDQRICVYLFYMENLSVKDIAATLGISENTVKSRLHYGRDKVEFKVKEMEKKGVKLYSLTPLAFFLWLLKYRTEDLTETTNVSETVLSSVLSELEHGTVPVRTEPDSDATPGADSDVTPETVSKNGPGDRSGLQEAGRSAAGSSAAKRLILFLVPVGCCVGAIAWYFSQKAPSVEPQIPYIETEEETMYSLAETDAMTESVFEVVSEAESETEELSETEIPEETEALSEAETPEETEAPSETEAPEETEALSETEMQEETEAPTEAETQRETSQGNPYALLLEKEGLPYVGDLSQTAEYIYTGIGTPGGSGLQTELQTGVVSGTLMDFDRDGEDELVMITMDRRTRFKYSPNQTEDESDFKVGIYVFENRGGEWEKAADLSEDTRGPSCGYHYPDFTVYRSPEGDRIYINDHDKVAVMAQPFHTIYEVSYDGGTLTMEGYSVGETAEMTDRYNELNSLLDTGERLARIYVPEIFDEQGNDMDPFAHPETCTIIYADEGDIDFTEE